MEMKRRWKIVAIVLILIFVLPILGNIILSNPTSLPIEKGDRIYLETTTFLNTFTIPVNLEGGGGTAGGVYVLTFFVSRNSTLVGAWKSSAPVAFGEPPLGGVYSWNYEGSGVINMTFSEGWHAIDFVGGNSYGFTTITITKTIQLIPPSNPVYF